MYGSFSFFPFLFLELKILEKIKKKKKLGLVMNYEFLELNNGFVHRCYHVSLDNILVSFLVFLDVDYNLGKYVIKPALR